MWLPSGVFPCGQEISVVSIPCPNQPEEALHTHKTPHTPWPLAHDRYPLAPPSDSPSADTGALPVYDDCLRRKALMSMGIPHNGGIIA